MSSALLERPLGHAVRDGRARGPGRGLTLERRLGAVLAAAEAGNQADCPLCRGSMTLVAGEAVCDECGSRLS